MRMTATIRREDTVDITAILGNLFLAISALAGVAEGGDFGPASGTESTAWPHFGQNLLPAFTSFPQLGQNMSPLPPSFRLRFFPGLEDPARYDPEGEDQGKNEIVPLENNLLYLNIISTKCTLHVDKIPDFCWFDKYRNDNKDDDYM
jgi:hypothetical protein